MERSTRYTLLLYLPNGHSAAEVQDAVIAKLAGLPDSLRLSLTWDQGSELAQHRKIASRLGLEVYFCDPHSPWQRGTNENTNGLLRQYLPKGTDLSVWSEGELDVIAGELNDRPRKTLDWDTPRERFWCVVSIVKGVATTPRIWRQGWLVGGGAYRTLSLNREFSARR